MSNPLGNAAKSAKEMFDDLDGMTIAEIAQVKLPPLGRGKPSNEYRALREKVEDAKRTIKLAKQSREPAEILATIQDRFEIMVELTRSVIKGDTRSLIISGAPGIGKSFNVETELKSAQLKKGTRYKIVKGVQTPINLFKNLWEMRNPGDVIVFDDADGCLFEDDAMTLLLAATDTTLERMLSWYSEASTLADEGIDKQFLFEGSILFISNIDFEEYLAGDGKTADRFRAFIDRADYLDLRLHTRRELSLWVEFITRSKGLLTAMSLTSKQQDEALAYVLKKNVALRSLSLRTVLRIGGYMKASGKDWQRTADAVLLKSE